MRYTPRVSPDCRFPTASMPLPESQIARTPLHTRSIRVHAFARADDSLDLEAELIDVKAYDIPLSRGVRRAGEPIHHMWLRITVDQEYTITEACTHYDAAPYGAQCGSITPEYGGLVGMNLLRGFRRAVKDRFGRAAGCTHLSELTAVLPTAAIQARAGERRKMAQQTRTAGERPFQLGACHALRLDGAVVQEFYPQWYESPRKTAASGA